jgi:hypothetical protein
MLRLPKRGQFAWQSYSSSKATGLPIARRDAAERDNLIKDFG